MKIPQSKSQMAFVSAVKSVREDEIRKVEIAWATPDELELIRTIAAQLGRQIMNMSLPTVRMLRAKADDEIFAWFGCDVDHDPERPEAFSFFVDPRYRKIRAGRLIRFGVALFLKERGCQKLYGRVALSYDDDAEAAWSSIGFKRMEPEQLPEAFVKLCEGCNLYANECTSRALMVGDVQAFYEASAAGIGPKSQGDLWALAVHGVPLILEPQQLT